MQAFMKKSWVIKYYFKNVMLIPDQDISLSSHFDRKKIEGGMHLMLFSPWCYGHYASYLKHLIYYWKQWMLPGTLSIVVSPQFIYEHNDVVALATTYNALGEHGGIIFFTMTIQEQNDLESRTTSWDRAFQQYQLVKKYADQLEATQILYMYFDSCQLPFIMGFKLPCPFSGLYFRPSFHYSLFPNYVPTWKERMQQLRERVFLSRLLVHPQLKTLFCLDPIAVDSINKLGKQIKSVCLADPVEVEGFSHERVSQFKKKLGIEPGRRVFLSFGRLTDPRKGIPQLIKAVSLLSPEFWGKICLVFAGEPHGVGEDILESWLAPIRQIQPIQVIALYGYVPESDVQLYFQVSDIILAPYQKHVGMSGILLQAAAAQKNILSSDYGLMGEIVKRYSLGLTVNSNKPDEIAKGLTKFLLDSFDSVCNFNQMKYFAEQNSTEQFAKTIFQYTIENMQ
jgi:glycosyltransferase involved in cell wall biosynthesis